MTTRRVRRLPVRARFLFAAAFGLTGCLYDYEKLQRSDGGGGGQGGRGGAASAAGRGGAAGTAAGGAGGLAGVAGTVAGGAGGRGGASANGGDNGGSGGSATGRGGSGGAAGTIGPGAAGTVGSGGTSGTGAIGGRGGTTGAAGTAGTAGSAGTSGTGGNGGRGGTTEIAGTGGTSGTSGSGGRGGTGTTGANCVENIKLMGYAYPPATPCSACVEGGTSLETRCRAMIDCLETNYPCTGNCFTNCQNSASANSATASCVTGLTNAACAGGANSCPLGGVLDCSGTGALTLQPGGQVTDFSAAEWNATTVKFCDAQGLDGSLFQYAGTGATSSVVVDTNSRNLKLSVTVTAGQYAGGGLTFDSCVNASAFNAVQFTAAITSGSLDGCTWQVMLATQDQRASTATNPSGGTCASTCYQYPTYAIAVSLSSTPVTITVPFTGFNNPSGSTISTRAQIVGVQWQANSSSGTGTCSAELHIDDVRFVTQ